MLFNITRDIISAISINVVVVEIKAKIVSGLGKEQEQNNPIMCVS